MGRSRNSPCTHLIPRLLGDFERFGDGVDEAYFFAAASYAAPGSLLSLSGMSAE